MSTHPVQWHTPLPLWARFGSTPEAAVLADDQFRPALLRFASDEFMEEIIGLLEHDPSRLGETIARPETWRTGLSGNTEVGAGLIDRVPLPRIVQAALRSRALTRSKPAVDPIGDSRAVIEQAQPRTLPLKFYQPAHQRYYLATASLVCGVPGLPERTFVPGGTEQVGFLLRRLLPGSGGGSGDTTLREFAYVKDAQGWRWRRVVDDGDASALAPGEELLPTFPLAFSDELQHARTLWTGLIPVAQREQYLDSSVDRTVQSLTEGQLGSLAPAAAAVPANSKLARLTQFKMEVAEPWKVLVRSAITQSQALCEDPLAGLSGNESVGDKRKRRFRVNLQAQMQSWLILLDFADYLATYLPDVWNAIDSDVGMTTPSRNKELYDWLGRIGMSAPDCAAAMQDPFPDPSKNFAAPPALGSLREALKAVPLVRALLENAEALYGPDNWGEAKWPSFHFLLAGLDASDYSPAGAYFALNELINPNEPFNLDAQDVDSKEVVAGPLTSMGVKQASAANEAEKLDLLTALVGRALIATTEADAPPLPYAAKLARNLAANQGDEGWFVVRFVYFNSDCGPRRLPILSAASQRFQLASFFDPDAPARPIRITLPLDTSPAGLRKHSKNTAFVISDMLCGQIQRAKGLGFVDLVRQVLPWPLHKDIELGDGGPCNNGSANIGMICSLSIPIVTICALILLLIIVTLLDYIFRWLPYLIMCFPVIGLKGKKASGP